MQIEGRTGGLLVKKGACRVRSTIRVREKQLCWKMGEVVPRDAVDQVRSVGGQVRCW